MHWLNLLIIVIGAFAGGLTYAEDGPPVDDEGVSLHKGMVLVEDPFEGDVVANGEVKLAPYAERRGQWGFTFSAVYSTFDPVHYETAFVAEPFGSIYGQATSPMIEVNLGIKRNLQLGSIGVEFGGGTYSNQSKVPTVVMSSLTLYPVHVGATFALDHMSAEPLFVPYVAGGMYSMIYSETTPGVSFHGNTSLAPYMNGGVAICLDGLDPSAARKAYEDAGLESTYFLLEARKQFASSTKKDPDFSNDVSFAGGIRVEF